MEFKLLALSLLKTAFSIDFNYELTIRRVALLPKFKFWGENSVDEMNY